MSKKVKSVKPRERRCDDVPDLSWIVEGVSYNPKKEDLVNLDSVISKMNFLDISICGAINVKASKFYYPSVELEGLLERKIKFPYHKLVYRFCNGIYRLFNAASTGKKKTTTIDGDEQTIRSFYETASQNQRERVKHGWSTYSSVQKCEEEFWKIIRDIATGFTPNRLADYAADQEGSMMSMESTQLTLMNLDSFLHKIVHKYSGIAIGITVPMLYVGVWLSAFCFHTEDFDLWSISYLHYGAPKIWYILSPADARRFEAAIAKEVGENFRGKSKDADHNHFQVCQNALRHKEFLLDPDFCKENGLQVQRLVQMPGDLVVLQPRTYHQGFNLGNNLAESVNFAMREDIPYILSSLKCPKIKAASTMRVEFMLMESDYPAFLKLYNGTLEIKDPLDPNTILKPILELKEDEHEYEFYLESVESILAVVGEWAFARVGDGVRSWYKIETLKKLKWSGSEEFVTIPDHLLDNNPTAPPPPIYPPVKAKGTASPMELIPIGDDMDCSEPFDHEPTENLITATPPSPPVRADSTASTSAMEDLPIGDVIDTSEQADLQPTEEVKEIPCETCGKRPSAFKHRKGFLEHIRMCGFNDAFKCEFPKCARQYRSDKALYLHQRNKHQQWYMEKKVKKSKLSMKVRKSVSSKKSV